MRILWICSSWLWLWKRSMALEIPAEELENLTTVGSVVDYLKEHGIEG